MRLKNHPFILCLLALFLSASLSACATYQPLKAPCGEEGPAFGHKIKINES